MRDHQVAQLNQQGPAAVELVTDNQELCSVCRQLAQTTAIGLDTEFERTRTFFPRPALIQVCAHENIWLIDPLSIDDFQPFAEVLANPGITKIVHSASEDVELLTQLTGALPKRLFDTQIAAGLLGYGFSLGYRKLVALFENVELDKQETRSNWLKRPLRAAQLRYAALDVYYLPGIHRRLAQELDDSGRHHWLDEECQTLVDKQIGDDDFELAYQRVGQAWKLDPRQLGVLRALAAWREHTARRRNRPRAHVIKDDELMALSRTLTPATDGKDRARAIADIKPEDAEVLVRIVDKVADLSFDQLPTPLTPPADLRAFSGQLKTMKARVQDHAANLGMAPELLAHRRALEHQTLHSLITKQPGLIPFFSGWRREVIGTELLEMLNP